ncbi:MAG: hypothetical protein PHG66_00265 [Candidatus Colwellbacteria bacterium]|nr:hypothetical protein [Candidatus Colwellbacteria bacterium]
MKIRGIGDNENLCEKCHIENMVITDCKPNSRKLCHNKKCASCYKRSFSTKNTSSFVHPRNKNCPRYETCCNKNKLIFYCEKGHNFIKGIKGDGWCRECKNLKPKKLCDYKNLALDKGGEYILDIIPQNVTEPIKGWKCQHNHIWSARYNNISNGQWCPECAGNKPKILDDYKELAVKKGGEYILDNIPENTDILIKGWECEEGHIWNSSYHNILNYWCPVCAGNKPKILDDYKELAVEMGGEYILDNIPHHTGVLAVDAWRCENNHVWSSKYNSIQQNKWCPECYGNKPKILKDYKELAIEMGGEYILDTIPLNTRISVEGWKCKKNHIWKNFYADIRQFHWCPKCRWKSEQLCREILDEISGSKFIKVKPNWLENLELDGYCESLNLAFEYNGLQHYQHVPHFHREDDSFEKQQERDERKMKLCIDHGVYIIIIPYTYTYERPKELKIFIENEYQRFLKSNLIK